MKNDYRTDLFGKRLTELVVRAEKTGTKTFSDFVTPAEIPLCRHAAKEHALTVTFQGGYPEAERVIAGFSDGPIEDEEFPILAYEIKWPHQKAPRHQDLLGGLMALGLSRACTGDIIVMPENAVLFIESKCRYIETMFSEAGGCHLQVTLLSEWPEIEPPKGITLHGNVSSLRLDAVVSEGYHLSRGDAVERINAGNVKLNHVQVFKPDARILRGDVISLRGAGRLVVEEIGQPTKKDRLPLVLTRFGTSK